MNIEYSPFYDAEIYLGDVPQTMGTAYVGNLGLLQQLELRTGQHAATFSEVERETNYLDSVKNHMEGSPFENAFLVDELGVSAQLLAWRDALLMAGWDGTCNDEAARKLHVLAQIEADFCGQGAGEPDRWKQLCETLSTPYPLKDQIGEIRVDFPWQELPCLIRCTLEAVERQGVKVTRLQETEQTLQADRFKVVSFQNLLDAYEWISTARLPEGTAVVNRDNTLLNHVLYTWDKPRVHAAYTQSNPQLNQLFKLGISIFSRPLNIRNLVSYLLLPKGPIPAKLRYRLARLLINDGGFGEGDEWNKIIGEYPFVNKEGQETRQARAKKMVFLEPIRKDYSQGIPREELSTYISALRQWVQGQIALEKSDALRLQYAELQAQLGAFDIALSGMTETVQYTDIEKLVLSIYRPMNYSLQAAEQGSVSVVGDVRSIVASPNTILWLDCQEEEREVDRYDFLSPAERTYLQNAGVEIPDFAEHLRTVRRERLRYLAKAKTVVLVRSAYHGNTRMGEHSLIAELRTRGNGLPQVEPTEVFEMDNLKKEQTPIDTFEQKAYVELGPLNYDGRKESYTSLEKLITYPFDYVVEYFAKLRKWSDDQLKDTNLTQGEVAHYFFQHIIEDSNSNYDTMRQLIGDEYEVRFREAIDAKGLVLRLSENTAELNVFHTCLKESMSALIDIMEELRLTPVGCEMEFPQEGTESLDIPGIGAFGARIDLLLRNEQDEYVVFDFKWSRKLKRYKEKLQNNLAAQLELYRQAVQVQYADQRVAGVGYFLMAQSTLLTTDFSSDRENTHIQHVEPTKGTDASLIDKLKNAYEFRMKELKQGHIEEAEEMDMSTEEGCYLQQEETDHLYPIKDDSRDLKKWAPYEPTYLILKGKLK